MRLAVFVDQVFWRDARGLSTDESYALFLASLKGTADQIVLIGREAPRPGLGPYALDSDFFSLCPLPYYPNLYRLWRADPRIYGRIRRAVAEQVRDWDAILISGPHPIGQMIARVCARAGIPLIPVVRQNMLEQMGAHSGLKRLAALAAARVVEYDFRRLARGRTVLAVGAEMTKAYGRLCDRAYNHFVCLVGRAEFEAFARMQVGNDPTRLICACRLAPEKGHAHLFAALVELRRRGLECRVDVVGTGALEADLRRLAERLGLAEVVTFHGYVPYGEELFALYRQAGALVLPSLTEGFPQVINEALSLGLPVVATAVGGVPSFLTDGDTALLVPPRNPSALADAIERLARDADLRAGLARRGRALMAANTLETNRDRVLEAVRHAVGRHSEAGTSTRRSARWGAGHARPGVGAPDRSALDDAPALPAAGRPRVSLVVPLRNEIDAVNDLVADIVAQDYPDIAEVWLVDGSSTDGTREALQRLRRRDSRLKLIDNPAKSTAAGLNRALGHAVGDVVMRLDAHASYGPDLVRVCVETLMRTGAGGVGCLARPTPAVTLVGRAIVAAHRSPFGVGVAKFRQAGGDGWAPTVWNGCYWRHVLARVGPMREDLPRAEDNDFNQRVRALGYGLYVTPDAQARYRPRRTLGALWRQYLGNGLGVARTLFENPAAVSPYHLAPLALVGGLLALLAAGAVWPIARSAATAGAVLYLGALLAATVLAARAERGLHLVALPVALATLHVSYGLGSLLGIGRRAAGWLRWPAGRRA